MFVSFINAVKYATHHNVATYHTWPYIVLAFCTLGCCTAFYKVMGLCLPRKSQEWRCRIICFLHGVIISLLCCWSIFVHGLSPLDHSIHCMPSSLFMQTSIAVSLGYFVFDFVWCIKQNTEGAAMMIHHLITVFGFSVSLYCGKWGAEISGIVLETEMTNPLLQIRWFLRQWEGEPLPFHDELKVFVDFFFMSLFGVNRVIFGTYLTWNYFDNPKTDIFGRSVAISMYLVGWVFWISICSFGWYKYLSRWFGFRKSSRPPHTSNLGVDLSSTTSSNGSASSAHVAENKKDT